jgi:hypothetical protein
MVLVASKVLPNSLLLRLMICDQVAVSSESPDARSGEVNLIHKQHRKVSPKCGVNEVQDGSLVVLVLFFTDEAHLFCAERTGGRGTYVL